MLNYSFRSILNVGLDYDPIVVAAAPQPPKKQLLYVKSYMTSISVITYSITTNCKNVDDIL